MGWSRSAASAIALVWIAGCPAKPKTLGGFAAPPPDGTEIVCPVTGERCTKGPETEAAVFEMRTFYFCKPDNRAVFVENPERYAFH